MASSPSTPKAVAQRTPAIIAIERMAKMASSGATPARMVDAVDQVLIQWGAEELDASEMRERVEQLQNDIDAGIQAAEDYVAEAETEKQKAAALGQVEGLTAVRARLIMAMEGRK